ncbi:GGACT domain containing protein [Pyrenophora teres f. maculata]|nr:GGACT domain containing protein [Pyrenophora teres f. maculata]
MTPPSTSPLPLPTTTPTIYFGYGSNLWHHQMLTRCPTSRYIGVARLRPYTWLINDRGYANVVSASPKQSPHSDSDKSEEPYKQSVYGLVYTLLPADEARLDVNEGVPVAYTKEYLECDFWAVDPQSPLSPSLPSPGKIDTEKPPTSTIKMLVYIDRKRTTPSTPREEYVYRMNRGIEDAVKCGVPGAYVKTVMRVYIPADDDDDDDDDDEGKREKMAEFAKGQAARFRDESGVLE